MENIRENIHELSLRTMRGSVALESFVGYDRQLEAEIHFAKTL